MVIVIKDRNFYGSRTDIDTETIGLAAGTAVLHFITLGLVIHK